MNGISQNNKSYKNVNGLSIHEDGVMMSDKDYLDKHKYDALSSTEKKNLQLANEIQDKIYKREDELRQEAYNREDTKYQRTIADMRKAGINPNQIDSINTTGYNAQSSNNEAIAEQVTKQLEDGLQDQQLSNETFNKILQVVGSIIGIALFKKPM